MSNSSNSPPRILIVVSSITELNLMEETLLIRKSLERGLYYSSLPGVQCDFLCPGPGLFPLVYRLGQILSRSTYDLVINAGICGSFSKDLKNGSLVNVREDCFADFGAEDQGRFLRAGELGLLDPDEFPFENGFIVNSPGPYSHFFDKLQAVRGISVMRVTGTEETASLWKELYNPVVESMEGAGFFYVCRMENTNFVQIRAVSNRVGKRDLASWDIPVAMRALTSFLKDLLRHD